MIIQKWESNSSIKILKLQNNWTKWGKHSSTFLNLLLFRCCTLFSLRDSNSCLSAILNWDQCMLYHIYSFGITELLWDSSNIVRQKHQSSLAFRIVSEQKIPPKLWASGPLQVSKETSFSSERELQIIISSTLNLQPKTTNTIKTIYLIHFDVLHVFNQFEIWLNSLIPSQYLGKISTQFREKYYLFSAELANYLWLHKLDLKTSWKRYTISSR